MAQEDVAVEILKRIRDMLNTVYADFPGTEENREALMEVMVGTTATLFMIDVPSDSKAARDLEEEMKDCMNEFKKKYLAHIQN